jgi:glycosyltransferase involved in cell wall biosynthesis
MRLNPATIFLCCDWYLPGYKAGGPIQACHNIVETLKDRYQFFIFTADRDLGDKVPYHTVPSDQWVSDDPHVKIWYASPSFVTKKNLWKLLREVRPDIVYFNSMYSYKFTLLPLWLLLSTHFCGKIILAPRGMLHSGALQQKMFKKNIFLRVFKVSGWHKRIYFQATDDQELQDILFYFGKSARATLVSDIPNLYDKPWQGIKKVAGELKCVFISRIEPKKNLLFFLESLKALDHALRVSLDIFGAEDSAAYSDSCRSLAAGLGKNIQVQFLGPLPNQQVYPTLLQYHIFVLTTLGENFGYAIMEALSAGRPVLISDQTPWRGLKEKKRGWDLPLARPELFEKAVQDAVAFDQAQFDQWSQNAWQYAHDYGQNLNLAEAYHKLFE